MPTFKAKVDGKYLSMTVVGRNISIHESKLLYRGEKMERPEGAYIMFIAEAPEPEETQGIQ